MRYLLVAIILLTFLSLWSQLPDPKSEIARPDAESTPEKSHAMKVHLDQIEEPDAQGRIKVGVQNWFGPDPAIPGYVPWRVDLNCVGHPPRVVTYNPVQSHV